MNGCVEYKSAIKTVLNKCMRISVKYQSKPFMDNHKQCNMVLLYKLNLFRQKQKR